MAISPSGVERTFGPDELIVSKTDLKGAITYANQVFCRVSGYTEEELLGRPHSLIRHPDMPRAVFKLLWDELAAGREVFAYVLNLAADGAHYWVLAHVTPTQRAGRVIGYHSNRRLPDRRAIRRATDLYSALLTEERAVPDRHTGLTRSWALLEATLAEQRTTYPELVWSWTGEGVAA